MTEKRQDLMLVDRINLNHLRIFEAVYREKSMTKAAKELHLTQPGISQHIKALEETLDIKLFDRFQQKLVPTSKAKILYEKCSSGFYELEKTLWSLSNQTTDFYGKVSVGVPPEFGRTRIQPILSDFLSKHPNVQIDLFPGLASQVCEKLLRGDIDFGFVGDFFIDQRIDAFKVFEDIHQLCCTEKYLKTTSQPAKNTTAFYESLNYIAYQPGEPVLRKWLDHHTKKYDLVLNVRAFVSNPMHVLEFIKGGLGAGILPQSIIDSFDLKKNKLYIFPGSKKPQIESISIATLRGRSHSRLSLALKETVLSQLANI